MILPEHSPLGASSAERWMNCPGSTHLLAAMDMSAQTDEPDYRAAGTRAHAVLSACLADGWEAWELIGEPVDATEVPFDAESSGAVQVALDYLRGLITEHPDGQVFVEYRVSDPAVHPLFYGRVDFGLIDGPDMWVVDYKHGQGVVVEIDGNAQTRYYAYGLLRHPDAAKVENIHRVIVQPRIPWHPDGVVRSQTDTAEELNLWAATELIPAMAGAAQETTLVPGEHCRFCPAKLACPVLGSAFRAAASVGSAGNAKERVARLTPPSLDLEYRQIEGVMIYVKALREEALRRALTGAHFDNLKLVRQKANRAWRDGAEARFTTQWGDKVMSKPAFLSPAQVEKIDGDAKALVAEWAYTPDTGYTLAPRRDARAEVTVQTGAAVFQEALAKLEDAA